VNQFSAGAVSADVRVEVPSAILPPFSQDAAEAIKELAALTTEHRVAVFCQNPGELQRFQELIAEFAPDSAPKIEAQVAYVHRGFIWRTQDSAPSTQHLALVPYHELLHRYHTRRRAVRLRAGRAMDTFLDFAEGEFVVHAEHGIARFIGLKTMKPPR